MLNVHWRHTVSAIGLSLMLLAIVGCTGGGQIANTPALPTTTYTPAMAPDDLSTEVPPTISTPIPTSVSAAAQQKNKKPEQNDNFWNKPMHPNIPECKSNFNFTHKIVEPSDVEGIFFGSGAHVAPHDHMATWSLRSVDNGIVTQGGKRQIAERIQLYTPTDIFHIHIQKENRITGGRITTPGESHGLSYVEWGGYLYACDGHELMIGHLIEPSDEMEQVLAEIDPICDKHSCLWDSPVLIPAGTPIFRSSGYVGIFDFGLSLAGMTSEDLINQAGYGYSITPWRVPSGNSVCPLEYFPEPLRSDYLALLGIYTCGPFNQDVPGTAMGFWLPSSSPNDFPGFSSDNSARDVDEWQTIWLFQSYQDNSFHSITVGNNTFGLNQGKYTFSIATDGSVNQRWDFIKPGQTYCSEIKHQINNSEIAAEVHRIVIVDISNNGRQLTIEALDERQCGDGPWSFQGGERTFYR